jgi:hypothetical protein
MAVAGREDRFPVARIGCAGGVDPPLRVVPLRQRLFQCGRNQLLALAQEAAQHRVHHRLGVGHIGVVARGRDRLVDDRERLVGGASPRAGRAGPARTGSGRPASARPAPWSSSGRAGFRPVRGRASCGRPGPGSRRGLCGVAPKAETRSTRPAAARCRRVPGPRRWPHPAAPGPASRPAGPGGTPAGTGALPRSSGARRVPGPVRASLPPPASRKLGSGLAAGWPAFGRAYCAAGLPAGLVGLALAALGLMESVGRLSVMMAGRYGKDPHCTGSAFGRA